MIILALDSATSNCSIALWRDDAPVAVRGLVQGGQGDALPGAVAALLAEAGVTVREVTRLAVTIGPGRFTGLRAGLAFMRGLSLACELPIVAVTTLEAVIFGTEAAPDETRIAVIDSKRAELFFQIFDASGTASGAPFAAPPDALSPRLAPGTRVVVIGEAAAQVAAALEATGVPARAVARNVDAADVALIAATRAPAATPPAPLYIHPPATTTPRATPLAMR